MDLSWLKPFLDPLLIELFKYLEKKEKLPDVKEDGEITHAKFYRIKPPSSSFDISINYWLNKNLNPYEIVFFHGFLSSEKAMVEPDLFATMKWVEVLDQLKSSPTILSLSLGKTWMLYPQNVKRTMFPNYATVNDLKFMIEAIENKHEINKKRILIGSSMGGFNALQMYLNYPDMWSRCILHVPMVIPKDKNPYNWFDMSLLSAPIIRSQVPQNLWPQVDPIHYMRSLSRSMPPLQIQVSKSDEFKLYDGGKYLAGLLTHLGIPVSLIENEGGHKDLNVEAASAFIGI